MISLNDFTKTGKLNFQAKEREEKELQQQVKALKLGWGEESTEEIESFLDRCGKRYLIIADQVKKYY